MTVATWDEVLLEESGVESLTQIGRERRLVLEEDDRPHWVDLCWVDEVALTLADLARAGRRELAIVYPAPAGQVAVLLAAQLLLHAFTHGMKPPSIGIVTADPGTAVRTWNAFRIATTGDRVPIADVFPCYRAGPEGESPAAGRRLQGVIIGHKCKEWPIDHLIVDHLAGFVGLPSGQPSIEIYADPLDAGLRQAAQEGRLIWGWSESGLALGNAIEVREEHTVPYSVASDRLENLASGVEIRLRVTTHPGAEAAAGRVREDLRMLRSLSPERSDRNLERGLSSAWHHLTTLTSLPCTPGCFDRFAGVPPMAARATRSFAPELAGWASTLHGDVSEVATLLANDIADLRAELERGNPFEEALQLAIRDGEEVLVITRTHTATQALMAVLDASDEIGRKGRTTIQSISKLHKIGTWQNALMIGEPSPWDWHRLLSGLAPKVDFLTLGKQSAANCIASIEAFRAAREKWGSDEVRGRTWLALKGVPIPESPESRDSKKGPVFLVDDAEFVPEPEPFEAIHSLFELDPIDFGGEGPQLSLAREGEGDDWTAVVPAYRVATNRGRFLLEAGRPIDVRKGSKIVERLPEQLTPGTVLLVGRREGRVGLLEALEERLSDRPDLIAVRLLVDQYRRRMRTRFEESEFAIDELHRALIGLGCDKADSTVRSWVTTSTMAPQQYDDLERLNRCLELGYTPSGLHELFKGVQHLRGFRRAAGRALAAAAMDATVVADENHIDSETGLSIADLREAVLEVEVIDVSRCEEMVPLTLLGRLDSE